MAVPWRNGDGAYATKASRCSFQGTRLLQTWRAQAGCMTVTDRRHIIAGSRYRRATTLRCMPAEFLRLPSGLRMQLHVDQRWTGERHCLVEGGAQLSRILDIPAPATERLHHLVV